MSDQWFSTFLRCDPFNDFLTHRELLWSLPIYKKLLECFTHFFTIKLQCYGWHFSCASNRETQGLLTIIEFRRYLRVSDQEILYSLTFKYTLRIQYRKTQRLFTFYNHCSSSIPTRPNPPPSSIAPRHLHPCRQGCHCPKRGTAVSLWTWELFPNLSNTPRPNWGWQPLYSPLTTQQGEINSGLFYLEIHRFADFSKNSPHSICVYKILKYVLLLIPVSVQIIALIARY